ncbi:MAG: YHS domain-containing protein [Armatimonadetes bacterium]|nr:YHS domain-containing protein [Armatimonadota bacterium]
MTYFSRQIFLSTLCGGASLLAASPVVARQESPLVCPVMKSPVALPDAAAKTRDLQGVRYAFCCPMCEKSFDKQPAKFTGVPKDKTKAVGVFLFDPVTTKRLDAKAAVATSVYEGVLYPFASAINKTTFDKSPKQYATRPAKELLFCPVSDEVVKDYASASDYSDYNGERIYMCCPGCKEPFDKEPTKYKAKMDAFRAKLAKTTTGVK